MTRHLDTARAVWASTTARLVAVGAVFSAVMLVGVVALTARIEMERNGRQVADRQLVSLATPIAQACAARGAVAAQLGGVCAAATEARDGVADPVTVPLLAPLPPVLLPGTTRTVTLPPSSRTITVTSVPRTSGAPAAPTVVVEPPTVTETVTRTVTVAPPPPPPPAPEPSGEPGPGPTGPPGPSPTSAPPAPGG